MQGQGGGMGHPGGGKHGNAIIADEKWCGNSSESRGLQ
jgi:hypothetical protein